MSLFDNRARRNSFNSTLVRLKLWKFRLLSHNAVLSFNSTLVRLKPMRVVGTRHVSFQWFQFHTGSIKASAYTRSVPPLTAPFQFHTGSIKAAVHIPVQSLFDRGFNSTLVRLKHVRPVCCRRLLLFVSIPHWFD